MLLLLMRKMEKTGIKPIMSNGKYREMSKNIQNYDKMKLKKHLTIKKIVI